MATAIKWGPSVERLNLLEKYVTVKTNRARTARGVGADPPFDPSADGLTALSEVEGRIPQPTDAPSPSTGAPPTWRGA